MNQKSETIAELFKALCKAQAVMEHAKKDALNPHFRSAYADLASIWDALRKPLSDNGLSVIQIIEQDDSGNQILVTILGHTSGEYIESRFKLLLDRLTSQSAGSAITYARRYTLSAICGLSQDDDDGEIAEKSFVAAQKQSTPQLVKSGHDKKITPAQRNRLFAIAKESGLKSDQIKSDLKSMFNIESSSDLTMDQYNDFCDRLTQLKNSSENENDIDPENFDNFKI